MPRYVAVGENAVWVVSQQAGTVSRVDPSSNMVAATIEVGSLEGAGNMEVASGSMWVRRLGDVARIDPRENRVTEFYGPTPGWGALGSDGTSVWVSSPDANLVWRLSP